MGISSFFSENAEAAFPKETDPFRRIPPVLFGIIIPRKGKLRKEKPSSRLPEPDHPAISGGLPHFSLCAAGAERRPAGLSLPFSQM